MPMLYQILIDTLEEIANSPTGYQCHYSEVAATGLARYHVEKDALDLSHRRMLEEDAEADLRRDLGIPYVPPQKKGG